MMGRPVAGQERMRIEMEILMSNEKKMVEVVPTVGWVELLGELTLWAGSGFEGAVLDDDGDLAAEEGRLTFSASAGGELTVGWTGEDGEVVSVGVDPDGDVAWSHYVPALRAGHTEDRAGRADLPRPVLERFSDTVGGVEYGVTRGEDVMAKA